MVAGYTHILHHERNGELVRRMSESSAKDDLMGMLSAIDGFAALDTDVLRQVMDLADLIHIARGDALIREGEPADTLYLVISGRFTVFAGALAIAEVQPGEPVGELAFFSGGTRTASVIAARNSAVLALSRDAYERISAQTPALANGILASLSKRLASTVSASPGLRPRAGQVVALLPGANAPIAPALISGLRGAFADSAHWRILDDGARPDGMRQDLDATVRWLQRMEAMHDTLLLICRDADADPVWRRAITNNSDTIFIAVPKTDFFNPLQGPSALERQVYQAKMEANVHLVLYRDTAVVSRARTVQWLVDRAVGMHHHVALDTSADIGRLARFIRGEAVGLVMCGGGSFGTAHLGAIRYLQDNGFHFDYVGGTSVGAAMAGALAMGLSPDHVMTQCEDIFLRSKAMSRYTLPRHGLLDHHTLDAAFLQHYGTQDVEDLPLNFYAVATSLTFNDVSVLRTGPLWQAIRASTAIPGIFPPMICHDGEVLIDGSLIDNVPVEAMRQLKQGPNIVLNFLPTSAWRAKARYEDLPTRAQTLGRVLRKPKDGAPRLPTAFAVLQRAMVVNARRLLTEIDIGDDVLLNLSVLKGMSFMDWRMGRDLFHAAHTQMELAMGRVPGASPRTQAERFDHLRAAATHLNAVAAELGLTTR